MPKAILLFSTGLDSTLAFHILRKLGIEVVVLVIKTPFTNPNEKVLEEIRQQAKVIIYEAKEDYLELVKKPKFGYGKNMNPCIDCKIYMFKIAKKILEEEKADFIASGEVLNQRKFSQTLGKLKLIEKEAGVEGLVVRPLSGKLLPETLPEKMGLIDRKKLLDIEGAERKKHMELVEEFGINYFSQPAGGCLLTDPIFSIKLRDLKKHNPNFSLGDVELLKIGRHFRIGESKLILGRNEAECKALEKIGKPVFLKYEGKGPSGIFVGDEKDLLIACEILASYCKEDKVKVEVIKDGKKMMDIELEKKDKENFRKFLITKSESSLLSTEGLKR
jgi:tRNA U34 2-thiouridine synthase MnmA/TrmU